MAVNDDSARRRRRRARETRIEIDIEAEIRAKYPNRRVDLVAEEARRGDGASWSASAEAGFGAIESVAQLPSVGSGADELAAEPEMRELVGVGVSDRPRRARRRSGAPVAPALGDDWDPSQPLPGEPEDRPLRRQMRSAPQLAARLTESVGDSTHEVFAADRRVPSGPPDAYEMLRRQRDHIHSVRTDALRRASQAESSAERAATARERAARLVREGRRLDEVGRRVSAEVPAAHDSWKAVHELRIESLKRAAEAEHGAERVAMLREKAARLLSEQRRLEAEMAKQLALRTR
jgi:hypothetical protein